MLELLRGIIADFCPHLKSYCNFVTIVVKYFKLDISTFGASERKRSLQGWVIS